MDIKILGDTKMEFKQGVLTNKHYTYNARTYKEAIDYLKTHQNINGTIIIHDEPLFRSLEIFYYNYEDEYTQINQLSANQVINFLEYLNDYSLQRYQ